MIDKEVQISLITNLPAILGALATAGVFNAVGTWFAARQAKQAKDETRVGNAVLADVHASVKTISDQSLSPTGAAAMGAAVASVASEQAHSDSDARLAEALKRISELEAECERLKADRGHRHTAHTGH